MNFLEAAYKILKQSQTPLYYTDITRRALADGLIDPKGQTPEASMGSRIPFSRNPNCIGHEVDLKTPVRSLKRGETVVWVAVAG